jgi:hypothetical protein
MASKVDFNSLLAKAEKNTNNAKKVSLIIFVKYKLDGI